MSAEANRNGQCSRKTPCSGCVKRGDTCHYTTNPGETSSQAIRRNYVALQGQARTHEKVIGFLKNLPYQEAQEVPITRRIRSRADMETIAKQVETGDLLLQLSVLPESRFRYEFPYRSQMPQDFVPNNPYLKSVIYEAASLYQGDQSCSLPEHTRSGASRQLRL